MRIPSGVRARVRALWRRLRGGELSRQRASGSLAVGLFIGSLPLYGLHFVLCLAVCLPLKLDVMLAYLAANISNPLVAPFLLTLEVELGALILTGDFVAFDFEQARATGALGFFAEALVGSLVVGSVLAGLGALLGVILVKNGRPTRSSELDEAIERTVQRYRSAPVGDRIYVASKLRMDPVVLQLSELGENWGDTLDLGSGRGQLGLLLLELGRVQKLRGFDWDARKVGIAETAAAGDARFEVTDLQNFACPPADTALLIDTLHYLKRGEQQALLCAIARGLKPGGRILIRDLDERAGFRSFWTKLLERIGARTGYNRARSLEFRSASDIVQSLGALGFRASIETPVESAPFGNVLLVAHDVRSSAPNDAGVLQPSPK